MENVNYAQMKSSLEALEITENIVRWQRPTYNELSKQALNCMISYIIIAYCEQKGIPVKHENIFKNVLFRMFQKATRGNLTRNTVLVEFAANNSIPMELFDEIIPCLYITKKVDKKFQEFLFEGVRGTFENKIFYAATNIGTYIELLEQQKEQPGNAETWNKKMQVTLKEINKYLEIPGVNEIMDTDGSVFKMLQLWSYEMRTKKRWTNQATKTADDYPLLSHSIDTAIFAAFGSMEKEPDNEKRIGQLFFMGLFHDLPEVWTDDWMSPLKDVDIEELFTFVQGMYDGVPENFTFLEKWIEEGKNIRFFNEENEREVLEEKLYAKLPEFLAKKLKRVMMEDENNEQLKAELKWADYLSAARECTGEYTLDPYFLGATEKTAEGIEQGKYPITPATSQLFEEYFDIQKKAVNGK